MAIIRHQQTEQAEGASTRDTPIHDRLVKMAASWLRRRCNCGIVLSDLSTANSQRPDAIGFQSHTSILVECKVMRRANARRPILADREYQYVHQSSLRRRGNVGGLREGALGSRLDNKCPPLRLYQHRVLRGLIRHSSRRNRQEMGLCPPFHVAAWSIWPASHRYMLTGCHEGVSHGSRTWVGTR